MVVVNPLYDLDRELETLLTSADATYRDERVRHTTLGGISRALATGWRARDSIR
jgi:hypothetical protein